jgi:hypothetical protein
MYEHAVFSSSSRLNQKGKHDAGAFMPTYVYVKVCLHKMFLTGTHMFHVFQTSFAVFIFVLVYAFHICACIYAQVMNVCAILSNYTYLHTHVHMELR